MEYLQEEVLSKLLEIVRLRPIQDLNLLTQQFERTSLLQLHPLPRHIGQEEPKINVEHLTRFMQHNIAVVPIFSLQEVHDQRVGNQTPHEVLFSFGQIVHEVYFKELFESHWFRELCSQLFLEKVKSDGIFHHF